MTTTEQTPTNPDEYNGWTNRETWATALHLSNDEGLYNAMTELVAQADRDTDRVGHSHLAGDLVEEWVTENVTDPVLYPERNEPPQEWQRLMISDVGSFYRVDWDAVADSFRD